MAEQVLTRKIKELEMALGISESELGRANAMIEQRDAEITKLLAELAAVREEKAGLEAGLKGQRSYVDIITGEKNELQAKYDALTLETAKPAAQAAEKIRTLEAELSKQVGIATDLQAYIGVSGGSRAAELQKQRDEFAVRNQELAAEVDRLRKAAQTMKRTATPAWEALEVYCPGYGDKYEHYVSQVIGPVSCLKNASDDEVAGRPGLMRVRDILNGRLVNQTTTMDEWLLMHPSYPLKYYDPKCKCAEDLIYCDPPYTDAALQTAQRTIASLVNDLKSKLRKTTQDGSETIRNWLHSIHPSYTQYAGFISKHAPTPADVQYIEDWGTIPTAVTISLMKQSSTRTIIPEVVTTTTTVRRY